MKYWLVSSHETKKGEQIQPRRAEQGSRFHTHSVGEGREESSRRGVSSKPREAPCSENTPPVSSAPSPNIHFKRIKYKKFCL